MQTHVREFAGESATGPQTVEPTRREEADADLLAFRTAVAEAERQVAVAVSLAGRVAVSGAAERGHGLPLDLLLAADAGLTGADRHTLITAGQVLDTMPGLAAAHHDGRVSWGQVRHVVAAVKRRSLEDRAVIDARITDTLADADRSLDPDGWCEAVDAAVDELASRRALEQREDRAVTANRLWAQQGFDGRVHGGFAYDPASAAVLMNALAACQGRPAADDPDRGPEVPTEQQQSAAGSLVEVCRQWMAGSPGARRARPAYVVDVDVNRLDTSQPGRLRLRLPGTAPRVPGRRLAADGAAGADVRVVVTSGGAPQAVSGVVRTDAVGLPLEEGRRHARALGVRRAQEAGLAALLAAVARAVDRDPHAARVLAGDRPLCDREQLTADDIPTATRIAVGARDQGCRFFGCDAPVDWCDVHHLVHREDGGDHHPDGLALFCRGDHRTIHEHGWKLTLDPATGVVTGRRGDRVWRTEPRGSPLAPAPPPPRRPPGSTRPADPRAGPVPDLPFCCVRTPF